MKSVLDQPPDAVKHCELDGLVSHDLVHPADSSLGRQRVWLTYTIPRLILQITTFWSPAATFVPLAVQQHSYTYSIRESEDDLPVPFNINISRGEILKNKQSGFKGHCGRNGFDEIIDR
jgi:hypothetical protein